MSATPLPVSTHLLFCNVLQNLSDDEVFCSDTSREPNPETKQRSTTVPSRSALHQISEHRSLERALSHAAANTTVAIVAGEAADARTRELRSCYFQVVKESVTAFAGRRLYQQLLAAPETCENSMDSALPSIKMSAADRQSMLRNGVSIFLQTVALREQEFVKLSTACAAQTTPPSCAKLAAEVAQLAVLRRVPLAQWTGVHGYNNWFVRCPYPSDQTSSLQVKRHSAGRSTRGGTLVDAAPPSATLTIPSTVAAGPKPLAQPSDVAAELRKYWKLHEEAAARARLEALRSHDTAAFVEHVSLLKISALLEIMEKTDAFMRRIGMRLEARASIENNKQATSLPESVELALNRNVGGATASHSMRSSDGEYARFRAYVASAKNEFKLMHRIDAFVSAQPAELRATLLPHQMDGLRFLASLHANHINGILADEMGVGKTIQTLAFLLHLREMKARQSDHAGASGVGAASEVVAHRPHLVLAPLSVVREWREACEQFVADSFRVGLFQELHDPVQDAVNFDLLLLPVHAVRYVGAAAARVQWDYIIVDEAHKAVANLKTITARAILALPCARRLVLTGTPLSSDLQELWSLLHFLNPSVFTDNDAFEEVFRRPFQVYGAKEMELTEEERGLLILRLHQVLRPFLLRRTKADIDTSLRMTFHKLGCPLTAMQRRLLDMVRWQKRTPTVFATPADDDSESDAEAGGATAQEGVETPAGGACLAPQNTPDDVPRLCCPPDALPSVTSANDDDDDSLAALIQKYLPGLAATTQSAALLSNVNSDRQLGLCSAGVSESTAQQLCNHAFLLPFFSQVLQRHGLDELCLETASADAQAPHTGAAAITLACSGKFLILHLLLSRLYVAGHKVVLFTHWLDCVDLISEYLHSRGWDAHAEVLTGSSSEAERKASVRRFRDDPSCLFFLLSIKAGGCGINLQAAHMVVLLDRDYTATNEDQALARVYRIGQRHTVRALYLATADESERRVQQRAAEKNRPRQAIIDDGVYQVTEATARENESGEDAAEEQAGAESSDTPIDVQVLESGEQEVATDALWRSWSCASAEAAERNATGGADLSAFWASLQSLVEALDALVLTEEDVQQDRKCCVNEEDEGGEEQNTDAATASPDASASTTSAPQEVPLTVVRRLQRTRPPRSTEELFQMLTAAVSAPPPLSEDAPPSADATPATLPTKDTPKLSINLVDPLHHAPHFWLEFAYLFRLASAGPPVLSAALNTAETNNDSKDDPAELQRRRQRREMRAARRVRLATVEVPDAFREKCYDVGVEDEEEIASRYLCHLDNRLRKRKQKRTET